MKGAFTNKFLVLLLASTVVSSLSADRAAAETEGAAGDEQALMALYYGEDELTETPDGKKIAPSGAECECRPSSTYQPSGSSRNHAVGENRSALAALRVLRCVDLGRQ